jgi:SAM-dependent methyltransferase
MSLLQHLARIWRQPASLKNKDRFFTSSASAHKMLTHVPNQERPSFDMIKEKIGRIQCGIQNNLLLSSAEKMALSNEAKKLSEFEFGRFLIANQGGWSGWWTYYCILGYKQYRISNSLDRFLLEEAPTVLATRERFCHFQKVIKQVIDNNCHNTPTMKLASIPGGMAADLLTLDLEIDPKKCRLEFVNIDLDSSVFALAKNLAAVTKCKAAFTCQCQDAWSLDSKNEFDLVASNGLNIYVPERKKVIALYESIIKALKPGGTLVTSALTIPPHRKEPCEWNFANIDQTALARQAGIFAHILQATWSNFCTTQDMIARLTEAGIVDVHVIPDRGNIFPTFVGRKPT